MRKLGVVFFTLLLICGGVYAVLKFGGSGSVKAPDNAGFNKADSSSTVQSITGDTPSITVTKSPNDEYIRAGGRTWFISHADNDDSIDWVLIKPNNAEYRPKDLAEIFPDFKIIMLSDDTVELNNIPRELDGWRIKAKFTNADCTVYSDTAFIYVVDYDVRYKDIALTYSAFCADGRTNSDKVSELALKNRELGLLCRDYNGDGTEELVVCASDPINGYCAGAIYDMYTIVHDKDKGDSIVHVLTSDESRRFYYLGGDRYYSVGSSNGKTDCVIYREIDFAFYPLESYWTDFDESGNTVFFHAYDGDRTAQDYETITADEFYTAVNSVEVTISLAIPTDKIK